VGEFVKGVEYWLGLSVYLPSDWPTTYPSGGRSGGILWQFHDRAGTILPLVAYHTSGGWQIQNQTYNNRTGGNGVLQVINVPNIPFIIGGWNDFVMNVKFSGNISANDTNGRMRVWVNGTQRVNYDNVQTYFGEQAQGPYIKWGMYQWSWQSHLQQELNASEPLSRTCYHDGLRIGNANSSYAEVMP
jgi:hypothetical protein